MNPHFPFDFAAERSERCVRTTRPSWRPQPRKARATGLWVVGAAMSPLR